MPARDSAPTLFTNARVFDASGRAPFAGEVLVRGQRIEAVSEASTPLARAGADVVDCGGATLLPGLIESHAHLSWPSSVGRIIDSMTLPAEEHLLVTAHNAKVTLDAGFTSAYSAGSLGPRFEIALRDEINAGYLPGPRLRASSLERLPDGALGVAARQGEAHSRGPEAMRAYVKSMAKAGVDSIKFLLSSDEAFTPGGSQILTYTDEEGAASCSGRSRPVTSPISCWSTATRRATWPSSRIRRGFWRS